jgi:O-antigen biosynthesis protein WbqP
MDLVLGLLALLIAAVPMGVVALIIKCTSKGPVIYKQKRVGLHNKEFMMYKFRSMEVQEETKEQTAWTTFQDPRVTPIGKFIRKTSIDELPQIYQVFTGKLSCIGPRPGLWNQVDLWEERQKYGANDVKPGITGWAQVNGRDELEIHVKAKLDGEYTAALNAGSFKGLAMDAKCFFATIAAVLRADGVVEGGSGKIKEQEELQKEEVAK